MQDAALSLIRAFPDRPRLVAFAARLLDWLNSDLNPGGEPFSESRARALLLATETLDEPTRHSFAQVAETEPGARIALYDLLRESNLADNGDVAALAGAAAGAPPPDRPATASWLALAVAAHAWRSGFPLDRLDPAFPPDPYSPAGQVIKRAAFFARQQVQRSATDRDKLARKLAYTGPGGPATLDGLQAGGAAAPLPPYYRPPVPVRYPEYTPGVQVDPDELEQPAPPSPAAPLSISADDLEPPAPAAPLSQPPLRIDATQLEPPARPAPPARPPSNVVMPAASVTPSRPAPARRTRRSRHATATTKLRIVVQTHPDGPGLYGLQVRVTSRGIPRYVAGTTNKDGEFLCELPVHADRGMTYDVDVTWPRDYGGEVERKSITLNADRTHFDLPFYRTLKA